MQETEGQVSQVQHSYLSHLLPLAWPSRRCCEYHQRSLRDGYLGSPSSRMQHTQWVLLVIWPPWPPVPVLTRLPTRAPNDLRAFTNCLYSSETHSLETGLHAALVLCAWVHLNSPSSDQKLFQCPFVRTTQSDLHLIPAADGL